jgi:hypothetical protein
VQSGEQAGNLLLSSRLNDSSISREAYHDDRDYVDFDLYDEEDTPFHRFTFNVRQFNEICPP